MTSPQKMAIHDALIRSANQHPTRIAIEEADGDGRITCADFDALSDRARDRLIHWGVKRGDRVGIYVTKSVDTVAVIYGALKAGDAYVPVDPHGPVSRGAYILNDCKVKAVFIERKFVDEFNKEITALGGSMPPAIVLDGIGAGQSLDKTLKQLDSNDPAPRQNRRIPHRPLPHRTHVQQPPPDSGSDAYSMRTTAKKQGDRYILNGSKIFVTNGPVADVLVIYANTDPSKGAHGGLIAFLATAALSSLSLALLPGAWGWWTLWRAVCSWSVSACWTTISRFLARGARFAA